MVLARMQECDNIRGLAKELGVERRLMYKWREQLDRAEKEEWPPPENSREAALRKEVSQLKRVLADKTLEVDFFKGALQKVEARRQQSDRSGARASTTKSGK
jgi:predicted RNase H-like nuclease (RuvC/YqgF family)